MPSLPTGTVTFLFTDIEGSTRLLQQLGDRYADVLATHHRLLRAAIQDAHGHEMDSQGDALFAAFPRAKDALLAAVAAQRAVQAHAWPDGITVRVRMGLHTGEPLCGETGYVGMDVHRAARIAAAGHGGQVLVSDVTQGLIARDLPEGVSLRDLGEHRLKDLAGPHRLFQVVTADLPGDFPALRSLNAHPNNLPIQLTSFVGRVREIAEIKALLSKARLVTLSGSGGAGKTRLALQVAADVVEGYPDGAWLAEFAPIVEPALVPKTVASALGVPEQPGRDMTETLIDAVRPKALLLVLDNCEHLLAACADLAAALLRASPQVRILATSREGLGVPGETLWRVPSLSLPDIDRLPSSEDLVLYEAVRLFVDRAVATAPGFTVTRENAPALAQVCQRLDGIPLAIELAAARVKVLAVEQIATRLDDRFRLLTGGSRMVLPRHQTLRAALDWSYALLSDRERLVLDRLSVFAGGWTLEAAEAICSGGGVEASDMLDLLAQLVDKSLVQTDSQAGQVRYRLLETVRQYGRDRLRDRGADDGTLRRHRDFFLELAERASWDLTGPDSVRWLDRLEGEHDNLRGAFAMSLGAGNLEEAARLAVALHWFWQFRGHFEEGWERLTELLSRRSQLSPAMRAAVLNTAGVTATYRTDIMQAIDLGLEALPLYRELGDKRGIAICAYRLGGACMDAGNNARAAECFEESMRLFRELQDPWYGEVVRQLGVLAAREGNYTQATARLEESIVHAQKSGRWWVGAQAHLELAVVKCYQGDYGRAVSLLQKCVAEFRDHGDRMGVAFSMAKMASTFRKAGDLAKAADCYRDGLALARELRLKIVIMECFYGMAALKDARRQPQQAARLLGVGAMFSEAANYTLPHAEQIEYDSISAALSRVLGQKAFAQAVAEGRALTLEQAIEYALADEAKR